MATISKRPNGHRWCWARNVRGKRQAIRLGQVTDDQATTFAAQVTVLESAYRLGRLPDSMTIAWLSQLDPVIHERVANTGLVEHRGDAPHLERRSGRPAGTLAFLLEEFPKSLDVKSQTLANLAVVADNLVAHFGADRRVAAITPGDADEFRTWLRQSGRKKSDTPLAYATVSRRTRVARQIFEYAVRKRWCLANPFAHMRDWCETNPAKDVYVPRASIERILEHDPDLEFQSILALVRYAGARPSDIRHATWDAIDWHEWRLVIRSPKTERSRHGGIRQVPIAPEIRPHLNRLWDQAEGEATYLFPRWRNLSHANLTHRLERRCRELGLADWPKPWNNLRASCETDWIRSGVDIFTVARWLGHAPEVALRHYNRVAADLPQHADTPAGGDDARGDEGSESAPRGLAERGRQGSPHKGGA